MLWYAHYLEQTYSQIVNISGLFYKTIIMTTGFQLPKTEENKTHSVYFNKYLMNMYFITSTVVRIQRYSLST